MKRLILVVVLVSALLVLTGGKTVIGNRLLAGCSGSGCNGTDPHATDCDDTATTITSHSISYGYTQIRKSTECTTYWARTYHTSSTSHYANSTLKYYYWIGSLSPIGQYQSMYTSQRYAGSGYEGCGYLGDTKTTSYYPENCTSPEP